MTVTPTSPTSPFATTPTPSVASTASPTSQALGINDFMKLLATQFQEQDPLKPMDDTAFIAQTAQFTALQQATTLTSQVSQMAANDYIGRTVSVNNPSNGQITTGQVTSVDTSGATPQIVINGAEYQLANITAIAPPTAPSSSTTTSH